MKIVITGGHFSPAYSVIRKVKNTDEILVIGRKYAFEGDKNETLEYKLCKKENIPFISINAGRLQRNFSKHTLPSFLRLPKGIYDAIKILKKENPDVILTFGGYVGLTVSLAAKTLNIPVILHEQTQKSGLSARLISKFASVICISFETSKSYFKDKNVVFTGNPIREEIYKFPDMKINTKRPIVYITGGSTGSHALNQAVFEIIDELLDEYFVVHQTGNSQVFRDYEKLKSKKESLNVDKKEKYLLKEFFEPEEVGYLLHKSDLVVSRAGANIVSELMVIGVVSLLIPLPHGQQNEQLENAIMFKNTGLGLYLEQKNLTPERLLSLISDMIRNKQNYLKNKDIASNLIKKDAAEKIIEQVYVYGRKGREKREFGN